MYGLPQAGILAQELLEQCLNKHGYHQSPITPGLWRHDYRPISFTLCMDDFGIKYVGREHAEHLASILSKHYKCSHDWDGQRYLGMTINWDYTGRAVHASMLDYKQHYGTWSGKQQCHEKIKVDGNEIPLASRPNKSTSIPPLLGGGKIKQR